MFHKLNGLLKHWVGSLCYYGSGGSRWELRHGYTWRWLAEVAADAAHCHAWCYWHGVVGHGPDGCVIKHNLATRLRRLLGTYAPLDN